MSEQNWKPVAAERVRVNNPLLMWHHETGTIAGTELGWSGWWVYLDCGSRQWFHPDELAPLDQDAPSPSPEDEG